MSARSSRTGLALLVGLFSGGCQPAEYRYGRFRENRERPAAHDVAFGTPDPTLDTLTQIVRAPARLLPLGPPVERELSLATAHTVNDYLKDNELDDLRIEIRTYDPAGQWRRLRDNRRMSPLWKYGAGSLSLLKYTLFPGRVWGTNGYNPYTETLSVNSDRPTELMMEAAVAKDFRTRRFPGPYAAFTALPGPALIRYGRAADDVAAYARAEQNWELETLAYRKIYPQSVSQGLRGVGPLVSIFVGVAWWMRPVIGLGGSALGRGWGYVLEKQRLRERSLPAPAISDPGSG
jgi:hypothetical protein